MSAPAHRNPWARGPLGGLVAGLAAAAVAAGCLTVPPASAQDADREPPQAEPDRVVSVRAIAPGDPYGGMEPARPAQRAKVDWPAGSADAVIGTGPVALDGLPVQAGPPTAWQLGGSDPAAGSVQVHVADRADAMAAGINGLMLVVRDTTPAADPGAPAPELAGLPQPTPPGASPEPTAPDPATASPTARPPASPPGSPSESAGPAPSPTPSASPSAEPSASPSPPGEPGPAAGSVGLRIDYRGFADAYGGAWASRLAASALPGCAADTTADDEQSCRAGGAVPFRNNPGDGSLSLLLPAAQRVELPGGGTGWVVAVAAGTGGPDGEWGASPLGPSAVWSAGTQGGSLSESYPLVLPPAMGGQAPGLALSYSAESVDGQTSATNNQSAAAGIGWSLEPGFIERRYQPCWQATAPDGAPGRADLCWAGDNAVAAGGPGAGELVPVAGQSGDPVYWRAQLDDGSKVERIGAAGSAAERWVVTATDGTRYLYGSAAGDASSDPARWRVPVVRDPAGAPQVYTDMVWRWNLVASIDAWGNTTSYTWAKHANRYQANGTADPGDPRSLKAYDASGRLQQIAYPGGWVDLRWGSRCWDPAADGNNGGFVEDPNPAQVPGCDLTIQHPEIDPAGAWLPDIPTDALCPPGAPTVDADRCSPAPVFYSDHRLARVLTGTGAPPAAGSGPGAALPERVVDDYALGQTMTNNSTLETGSMAFLWLDSVTRTGRTTEAGGQPVALPATVYTPQWLPNLASGATGDDKDTRWRPRILWMASGTGQQTTITFAAGDCTHDAVDDIGDTDPGAGNTQHCYPVRTWDAGKWRWWWWHKPVVASASTVDTTGGSRPSTTTWASEGAAWAYDDSPLTTAADRATSQWRGHRQVDSRTGLISGTGSETDLTTTAVYFQGIAGASVPGAVDGQAFPDAWWRQGQQLDQVTWTLADPEDPNRRPVSRTRTVADCRPVTGTDPCASTGSGTGRSAAVGDGTTSTTSFTTAVGEAAGTATTTTTTLDVNTAAVAGGPVWLAGTSTVHQGPGEGPGTLVRTTATGYTAGDGGKWLWNRPTSSTTTDPGGQTLTRSEMAYVSGNPSPGTVIDRSGSAASYDTTTAIDYDALGRAATIASTGAGTTRYIYTDAGRTVRVATIDALGHQSSSALDPRGNPVAVTDANGTVTTARYDGLGRLTGVWLDGRDTAATPDRQHSYRVGHWAQGATASVNSVTTWTLGPDGQQLASATILDGQLRTVQQQQTTGNPTQRFGDLDPDGDGYANGALITSIIRDARGLAIQVQGPYYSGQQVAARDAAEPGLWLPVARAVGLFPRTDTAYDGAGRAGTSTSSWPEASRDPGSPDPGPSATTSTTTFSYDGLTTTADAPSGGIDTSVTTDPLGRQTLIAEGSGTAVRSTVLGWDGLDRPTSATSGGLTWTRGYDGQDRVLASTDPDRGGTVARYTATSDSTSTTTTDASGAERTTTTDALGRPTTDTWSRGAATTTLDTTWDGLGLDTDGDGTADADAIGLPVLATTTLTGGPLPGVFASRSVYDRAGRTVSSTRVLPEAWDLGGAARSYTTGYAYRDGGSTDRVRLPEVRSAARLVLPAEELVVGYDTYGRPATVQGAGAHTSGTVYTPAGLPAVSGTEEAPGSGTWSSNRYDGAGQLTNSAWYTAGQTGTITQLADTSTAYDQAGNPVATAATGGTGTGTGGVQWTCASYDGLRRLDNWWTPGTACAGSAPGDLDPADPHATAQAWVFDPDSGLPTSSSTTTAAGTATTTIAHDTGSHRPAAADSTGTSIVARAFTWNPDGTPNTWTGPDGTAWTLGTDPAGNTDHLTDGTTSIDRALAPDGTLLAEKTTAADGSTVLTVPLGAAGTLTVATAADASTTVSGQRDYPRPDGTLASARTGTATTDTHAYRTDPQGTPLQTAGTTVLDGTTAGQARRYTPYGQQRGPPEDAWPTRSGWLGKQQTTGLAATGLIRLGARDYDPTLGVFTTTDPITSFGNPGSLDPYAYAGWNPLAGSDPDGTWPTWKGIKKAVKSGAKWAWDHKAEIAGVVASVAAGAAFCAATAGVGCLVIGGAIAGAVGSATTYGVQVAEGKRTWNTREFLKTTAIGAVVGGVTGGLAKGAGALASRAVSGLRNAAPGLTTAIADTAATARATLQRAASSASNKISTALRSDTGGISFGRGGAVKTSSAGADNVVDGVRLRAQLTGQEIAGGHAFEKHILDLGEFPGIRTRAQFASHIEDVVMNGEMRTLGGGRTAYWREGTVVIRNPRAPDGGTAFQPTDGYDYFLNQLN